jgi:hypothetical protein
MILRNGKMFGSDNVTIDSYSESDGSKEEEEEGSKEEEEGSKEEEPTKEVINKEAPEGIEVAEFDGLNINEEMG